MNEHKYVQLSWTENDEKVVKRVPTNWTLTDGSGNQYICWPNKVDVTRDLIERTPPGSQWRMYRVMQTMGYYGKKVLLTKFNPHAPPSCSTSPSITTPAPVGGAANVFSFVLDALWLKNTG